MGRSSNDAITRIDKEIDSPSGKGHVASETLVWLHFGVCWSMVSPPKRHGGGIVVLRVRMWRSRCSSRANDCPQYLQKTILLTIRLQKAVRYGDGNESNSVKGWNEAQQLSCQWRARRGVEESTKQAGDKVPSF